MKKLIQFLKNEYIKSKFILLKMNLDLTLELCNMRLPFFVYNAAGVLDTTKQHLDALYKSYSGAILSKSCTLEPRKGNEHPKYYDNFYGSINSNGLENLGYDFYKNYWSDYEHHTKKPFIISIAVNYDFDEIIKDCSDNSIKPLEINMSCPNIKGKRQLAYDFEALDEKLRKTCEVYDHKFGIKLPPYFDPQDVSCVSDIIKEYNQIDYITCINSLGNGLIINWLDESTLIRPKGGIGGIGGDYCKPTALANVRMFYNENPNLKIIGCGGVREANDVFEYILCGASGVQIGTQFMRDGHDIFERIYKEFPKIMDTKGYESIEEFRGKLKIIEN